MKKTTSIRNLSHQPEWFLEPIPNDPLTYAPTNILDFWCPYEEYYQSRCKKECPRYWHCPLFNPDEEE
jgi:hypothetical protein